MTKLNINYGIKNIYNIKGIKTKRAPHIGGALLYFYFFNIIYVQ